MSSNTGPAVGVEAPVFPNFMELRSYLPAWAWRTLRLAGVLAALAVAALLALRPAQGLPLFWGLIVPVLPLVFMLTPGVWRNICPLATSNQAPRRLGLVGQRVQRSIATGAAFPLGIGLFVVAIVARKLMFNVSGPATAGLIVGAMGLAFAGGLLFKGKSGWCSSICPLLPVQRLYGQTPFVKVANTQCKPCVGCAKNCYDFNPGAAYLADQYDADPGYREFRRFFAGLFPGLLLSFYLVPGVEQIGALAVATQMLVGMALSLAAFTLLDLTFRPSRNRLPVLSAALSINIYYWFVAPVVLQTLQGLGAPVDASLVGALRTAVAIASLVWVWRSFQAEGLFLREQLRKGREGEISLAPVVVETVRLHRKLVRRSDDGLQPVGQKAVAAANAARIEGGDTAPAVFDRRPRETKPAAAPATPGKPELRIEPEGRCVPLKTGAALLDVLEGCGAAIQAGCRAGACGADPIAVTGGADCLGTIGATERATLDRLGHGGNTRMACMARVKRAGTVTVELQPHAAGAERSAAGKASAPVVASVAAPVVAPAIVERGDPAVRRVVILGNGVAGLSAAQTLRQLQPDCEIHLVSRERHAAYNRIAVSGLINQRAGMQGLALKPEAWYAQQRIQQWLNTRATTIDAAQRRVMLATGEALDYDRLILATGAYAWVPPIAGFGLPGSYVLRQANDAMAIRAYAQKFGVRRALVVGAGLLGLEAADELRRFGLEVQVLSINDRVLDRQIDRVASARVIERIATAGIGFVGPASVAQLLQRQGRLAAVRLADGRELSAELLLVCAGTRPELGLARSAGLQIGRGVTVDAQMRSSDPHIWAAGDLAEFDGQMPGLWAVAAAQAEVAARAALGLPARYQPEVPQTVLKMHGLQVRSAGQAEAQGERQRALWWAGQVADAAAGLEALDAAAADAPYAQLVLESAAAGPGVCVVGAVVVGEHPVGDELIEAAQRRTPLATLQALLPQQRWRAHPPQGAEPEALVA